MSRLLASFITVLLFIASPAFAEKYEAGTHYLVLDTPVKTRNKDKIEVVELFWYGCSHCFSFEPIVKAWKTKQPDDVDFHPIPAVFFNNSVMKLHAQSFYTAKSLGVLDEVHQPIFNAIHIERKKLKDIEDIAALFKKHAGVDTEDFRKTFNSFGVGSMTRLGISRGESYGLQGTPEVIVNGKYRITTGMAGGQGNMLEVADFLIEKERAALNK